MRDCELLCALWIHEIATASDTVEWPTQVEDLIARGVCDADIQSSGHAAPEAHAKSGRLLGPVEDLTLTSVDRVLLLNLTTGASGHYITDPDFLSQDQLVCGHKRPQAGQRQTRFAGSIATRSGLTYYN